MIETDTVHTLTSLPATDLNFTSALNGATSLQIKMALEVMRNREGKDKGRIKACEMELKRRDKSVNYNLTKEGVRVKSVLKYPGAKNRLAPWICEYIPKHDVYLEPFAGSLAVLFNKQRSHIETVNDIDGEIVNFFQILRNRSEELKRAIEFTPFSRSEYKAAYESSEDELEQARRFAVKCWMGFGCGNLYQNGFKSGQQTNSPNPARAWSELPETLKLATERLKGVQIENLPAIELIEKYDTEDVFIYADPPYLHGTRKNYLYKYEMQDSEHEELLNVLVKHPGKILLSGYDNDMYNDMLPGWHKVQKATRAEGGRARTETLWMNYELENGQISLNI